MASDELVWSVIGTDFCSFKLKTTKDQTFCRNEYNTTGFCSRQSCPLANSRYATIRADPATSSLYLYIKEPERSHLPSKWWQKIKLSNNYTRALEQVDSHLMYYPKFLLHKNKQRLTRLTQIQIRVRKLEKEQERLGERLVPRLAPKVRRREEGRERKALAAAKVERSIERVLIERLRSGAYGDAPLNVEPGIWERVMNGLQKEGQLEADEDLDDGEEVENEYERELENGVGDVEYVSGSELDEDSDVEDLESLEDWSGEDVEEDQDEDADDDEKEDKSDAEDDLEALQKKLASLKRKRPTGKPPVPKKKSSKDRKGPRVEIEYEVERVPLAREVLRA